jgi:hypothetical protein
MPLSKENSLEIFRKINNGFRLKDASAEEVNEVFLAHSGWMAALLRRSIDQVVTSTNANRFIQKEDLDAFAGWVFEHAIMGKLRCSNGFNPVVEHDHQSWLDDAAELQSELFLRKMENYINHTGTASYREQLAFHKKIDFDACVAIVQADFTDSLDYLNSAVKQRFYQDTDTEEFEAESGLAMC